jgi:hypothetical protein
MKSPFSPTKATALTSGLLLGIAIPVLEFLLKSLGTSAQARNFIFLIFLCIFFVGPVLLFVVGTQYFRFGWRELVGKLYWSELWQVSIRALHWLIGAGLGFAILSAFAI